MPERVYSVKEVERGIRKLTALYDQDNLNGFERREGKEKWGWYYVEGQKTFFISSKLPSSGDVGRGRAKALREYLQFSRDQFEDLCKCPLSGPRYHAIIIEKTESGAH